MWNWFNCYLSGRHEFGPWCEPGTIFLRCVHCGKRSAGWAIGPDAHSPRNVAPPAMKAKVAPVAPTAPVLNQASPSSRVLPFGRAAAR